MKVRIGFVTNSSSSSFIIAVKEKDGEFSKEMDEQILTWAKENFIGKVRIRTQEELDDFANKQGWELEEGGWFFEKYIEAKNAIEAGYTVIENTVSFEEMEYSTIDSYMELFNRIRKSGEEFKEISTDMSY